MPAAALLALLGLSGCSPVPGTALHGDGVASVSAPLALSRDGRSLWVVNPDADSVTMLDTRTLRAAAPLAVGREPWAVAVTPADVVVVMNRLGGSLTLLDGGRREDVAVGPEPGGLALSPSGRTAYVTLSSGDALAVVDLERRQVVRRLPLGPVPWAVAVTDDGDGADDDETVVVTHRLARLAAGGAAGGAPPANDGKEGWVTLLRAGAIQASGSGASGATEVVLAPYPFGYPNGLEAVALHGGRAFVTHLLNQPEYPRDFDSTVSAALSSVAVPSWDAGVVPAARRTPQPAATPHPPPLRLHLNDAAFSSPVNLPEGVALAGDGATAYLVLAGSDAIMGIDLVSGDEPTLVGFWPAGSNPRGIAIAPDGRRAYVMNYLSRDVSVLDLEDRAARREIARVRVAPETLAATELRGKVLFHNASSSRVSQAGWISCATCHLSGGSDGTTWLTPDGPRQTMPLWKRRGTAPFHASATRDEVQDFERDIEELMAGNGLAPGAFRPELGEPNGARSADLDALAAYVLDGIRVPVAAPAASAAQVETGRALFAQAGCARCHGGPAWTLSSLPGPVGQLASNGEIEVLAALRDVGTHDPTRDVLGANGFDVPSLLGLHASAPYLHDGSAAALDDVLANPAHLGRPSTGSEIAALAAFLRGIDGSTAPF